MRDILLFSVTGHAVVPHRALPALAALVDLVLVPSVLHQGLVVGEDGVALLTGGGPRPGHLDQDSVGWGPVRGLLVGDVVQLDRVVALSHVPQPQEVLRHRDLHVPRGSVPQHHHTGNTGRDGPGEDLRKLVQLQNSGGEGADRTVVTAGVLRGPVTAQGRLLLLQ